MENEYKIGILGSPQVIAGFKALGLTALPVSSVEEGLSALESAKDGKFGVLLVTEDWADKLSEPLNELKARTLPAVTVLPSPLGSLGLGEKELKSIVERAVGSDILSKED
jgi:V/A-type H+/Na+-transporting ATPase subunit F